MAGAEGLDYIIKKAEESAVQKFKNQNKVLKRFKKPGLKVYKAITRKGISGAELSEKSGVPPEELAEMVSFMEKAGMVELEAGEAKAPKKEEKKEAKKEEEKPVPKAPPKEELPFAAPPRFATRPSISIQPLAPGKPPSAPALPPRAPPAAPPKIPPRLQPRGAGGEIRPISEEEMGREEKIPEEKPKPPKEEEKETREEETSREEEPELEKEEEGIKPIEFEEEKKPPAAAPRVPPRAPPRAPPEEIAPPPRAPYAPAPPVPPEEEEYLTPSEKAIKEKYGEVGLKVYGFIDGQRTAEQIMRETGVTEAQLIEMLDFMEKKGIIRLEHPERRRAPPPPPPRAAAPMAPPGAAPPGMAPPIGPQLRPPVGASQAPKTMFSPMVEEQPELAAQISDKELAAISLDIPTKATRDIIAEIQAKAKVMLKFGKEYVKAFELMDGKRDVVDLTLQLKLPLYKIYGLLKFLQELKAVMLKPSAREDIRRKYGEDGYSVYKKYGREGVLLYQLIGKDMSLKEMAALTTTEPSRIIEMFLFIHKLLGIELPIDEDVLRERLGIKKEEKAPPPA